jgi:arsenite methyltransferase
VIVKLERLSVADAAPSGARARYGIDGGWLVVSLFWLIAASLATVARWATRRQKRGIAALATLACFAVAGIEAGYLYCTGPGKRSLWSELLDGLDLRGDEQLLDVGCGRGAVLMLAAQRLPRGRAVGADIWRHMDQTGNSPSAAMRNAVIEGVTDRMELVDADARCLPFPSSSFDLVVSNLTIHNIRDTAERRQALSEAVRVLRPTGRLRVVDDGAQHYSAVLRDAGCTEITVRRLDWRTSFGIPGHHLTLVEATKPMP